jgi:sugar lactone lactonase YvrE
MNLAKQTRLPFAAASIAWVLLCANAFGAAGDLYVSVFGPGQNIVRISPDGTKTPVTGALNGPNGLAFDAKGVLHVAQYDGTIVKIINGTATPFVSGLPNQSFNSLAFDSYGYLYATAANGTAVTKIAPDGTKTTFASNLTSPSGIAIDRNNNVFVTDFAGSAGQHHLYKYASTGRATIDSTLKTPDGLALDAAGNLYCTDRADNTIYRYSPSGTRTIFVTLNTPSFLAFDPAGNLFVATQFGAISKITPNGTVSPFATTNSIGGITTEPPLSQPLNISTRVKVQTGDNALIGGFIATGTAPKKLLVRAIGPSLANFGVPGPLQDTTLEVRAANGTLIASNDNWKINDQTNQSQQAAIQATGLAPTDDRESALMLELAPGAFTAIVRGKNNTTGVGLVELYDLNQTADSRLANISTRAFVETGANVMIGGFIVGSGNGAAKLLIRALGPSLSNFGVAGALNDPTLSLRNANGVEIAADDDWYVIINGDDSRVKAIQNTGLAPSDDHESVILTTIPNGNYTAIVSGYNGATGVGVVEVYNLR